VIRISAAVLCACAVTADAFMTFPGYHATLALPEARTGVKKLHVGRSSFAASPASGLTKGRCMYTRSIVICSGGGATGDSEMKRGLDKEFLGISVPAFVQFAAEPLASLVDTMYLGKLGATALGAAGVAIGAQYSVSKLYNDPLLRTSISLVAAGAGQAQASGMSESSRKEQLSKAVTSALLLAAIIGVVQAAVYSVACAPIIRTMGLAVTSDMYIPAVTYLQVKALGTPGATMWLVVNGIFRGLGDTITPLKWALFFTALNAVLVPFFIFTLGMGCSGAACGTGLAQYIALVPLLMKLNKSVGIRGDFSGLKESLQAYMSSGVFMFVRTIGKILTYTLCAREAALLGTVSAAAYNVVFQLGTATTQICESFAVAAQALLARELQGADAARKKAAIAHVIKRAILAGGVVSALLSILTWHQQTSVLAGLTSDPAVLAAAAAIMPIVLLTQVSKGLAYPVNGVVMGGLDWGFLTASMWVCNAACCAVVFYFKPVQTIGTIWYGLCTFMSMQCITGLARILSRTGVWKALR
jgi:putative MATE family efflux protein